MLRVSEIHPILEVLLHRIIMKFLLTAINAKYIHSNPAIYSLRAFAGKTLQEHTELAEYTINQPFLDILADIYRRKPDVVGFSCYIWNISIVLELVTELHKILPDVPIWLGGPEVSFDAPALLEKYPMITGVMIGEGEETFRDLLQYYVDMGSVRQTSLDQIPGLCLKNGYTAMRDPVDMNALPFLYTDLDAFENKIIYYESSRGCPFRCSYCLSSIDKKVRLRNPDIVKEELQFFLDGKVKQVKFVDRTFNCNHEHAGIIWRYIKDHDNGVTNFHFEVSADLLNEEEIALLNSMRPGLVQLEIGVQSTNPDTIRAINRTMDVEKLEIIVRAVNAGQNVHQHLDLIAGLPYEDYESFGRSFNRVYEMAPEQLQLGFLKVLKGSYMHEKAAEYGICYLDKPPYEVLYTNWLSFADVLKLKKIEEMVELYYNSNQFRYTLAFLVKQFETPFVMFEKLAAFYEKKGYFTNSPARAYRYQVLLEFVREEITEAGKESVCRERIYRELLTYDMYLRENLKSRPVFAEDMTPYKNEIRAFYEKEEQERNYLSDYAGYDQKQLAKMTHMEVFHYPVWESNFGESEHHDRAYFVLFDYQNRNPLTSDARTICLTPGRGQSYVSIDLETTGLNPKLDKIIEIGAVKVIDGQITETFHAYVNPGRKLEERIMLLTGISQEQVDAARGIEEVFPELAEFLEELPLLGHRVLFDYSFLKKAAVNLKMPFERRGIDTLRIARRFLPQLEHRTLPYLCEYYGIRHDAHRAYADAEATSRLYEILFREYFEKDSSVFVPQELHYAVKKDSPITKAQKERLYGLIRLHNLSVEYDVEKLTRSEASRITDKIYSVYGREQSKQPDKN